MDAKGARELAGRIEAGVPIGSVIELEGDASPELRAGARGTVRAFGNDGFVVVAWENGDEREVDLGMVAFRRLAA